MSKSLDQHLYLQRAITLFKVNVYGSYCQVTDQREMGKYKDKALLNTAVQQWRWMKCYVETKQLVSIR